MNNYIYTCSKCKKESKKSMSKCAKCRAYRYCSKICQVQDWPNHRRLCVNPKVNIIRLVLKKIQNIMKTNDFMRDPRFSRIYTDLIRHKNVLHIRYLYDGLFNKKIFIDELTDCLLKIQNPTDGGVPEYKHLMMYSKPKKTPDDRYTWNIGVVDTANNLEVNTENFLYGDIL